MLRRINACCGACLGIKFLGIEPTEDGKDWWVHFRYNVPKISLNLIVLWLCLLAWAV